MRKNTMFPLMEVKQEVQALNADWFNRYLDYVDVSKTSQYAYKRNLKQLFKYFYDNGIKQPQRRDILSYRSFLQDKGLKATSIQAYMNTTRLFFRWTESEGLYPNIADHVKAVKVTKEHRKGYLQKESMKAVLEGAAGHTEKDLRDYAMLSLMVACGLRTVEVVRANVEDIRPAGAKAVLLVEGKGQQGNQTPVNVPAEVLHHLTKYLRKRKAKDGEPLFTSTSRNNTNGRMTTRAVSGIVKGHMRKVGIDSPFLTAHSLRHTAVTWSIEAGNDLLTVQEFARHGKPETTQIYIHSLKKEKNPCADCVAGMLFD